MSGGYVLRFAGAERASRDLQFLLNFRCERVRATKHAPRNRRRLLEGRHSLAELVERNSVHIAARCGPVGRRRRRML